MSTDPTQLLRDPKWVKRNSRWRYWTWTLFFPWVAFFWIGYRARNQRWVLYGLGYSLPFMLGMAVADNESAGTISGIASAASFIGGILAIFHARRVLPQYLA